MTEYIILDDFLPDEVISAADAQGYLRELVRCKDCKKRYSVLCIQEEAGNINNQDDWFCADGEKKEEC